MVISNSLTASRLGKMIPILPVPLPENTYRVVIKWRLWVLLLDQHRDHTHCILLRHFQQGRVDTVNADLDIVYWTSCLRDSSQWIRQLSLKRRVERRLDGMHLLLIIAMSSLLEALLMRFGLRTNVTALNISTFSYQKLKTQWKLFIYIFVEFVFPPWPIFRNKRLSFSWPGL